MAGIPSGLVQDAKGFLPLALLDQAKNAPCGVVVKNGLEADSRGLSAAHRGPADAQQGVVAFKLDFAKPRSRNDSHVTV